MGHIGFFRGAWRWMKTRVEAAVETEARKSDGDSTIYDYSDVNTQLQHNLAHVNLKQAEEVRQAVLRNQPIDPETINHLFQHTEEVEEFLSGIVALSGPAPSANEMAS